jgi:hypothetical protein
MELHFEEKLEVLPIHSKIFVGNRLQSLEKKEEDNILEIEGNGVDV